MPPARITAAGWAYRYPGRAHDALADVSVTVEPGELVVLMGASGSGKTTLLAALAGTLPEGGSRGVLRVEPDPMRIGLVQQEPEGNIVMERVGDDVAFPLENAAVPPEQIWPRVDAVLADLGLLELRERSTARLSGGQQQMLALAAAAVVGPGLLLLDEATANLDPVAAGRVARAVAEVRRRTGCTVLVVEHRVEPWLADADRVLLAEDGSVTAMTPGQLAGHLAARPRTARRVWVDHAHLPHRGPRGEAGRTVLVSSGVAVAGRLTSTDLLVRSGEVVALTGPPGSGKSTLLACLAGLLRPTSGTVRVAVGAQSRTDPWQWSSRAVAATFGVVFQNPEHQFLTGRVVDELRHGQAGSVADGAGLSADARVAGMLDRLHLTHLAEADPFTLSGGEQRRLSVGTALVRDPGILLLDEPTFGQDPATWAEMVDVIAEHRDAGGAVVLATHDPSLVGTLAAREVRLAGLGPAGAGGTGAGGPAPGQSDTARAAGAVAVGPGPGTARAGAAPIAGLRAMDPVALLCSAGLLSAAALVSGAVTVNLVLAGLVGIIALAGGLPLRRLGLLAAPVILAAVGVGLSNALLSAAGPASAAAWSAAALPASRILAVALPGLVAAVAVDPTALADSLVVRLRVPPRAAYSVLAGLRLLPLLADEWSVLGRASRARGMGGTGAVARASQFASMVFRLLVAALRRGGRLAVALDARGLRPTTPRTVARPPRWRARDTLALLLGLAALALAVATRV